MKDLKKRFFVTLRMNIYCTNILFHLLELFFRSFTHRAHPIGRQILKRRVGRDSTLNITKLRVIDPLAFLATILLHLFHIV